MIEFFHQWREFGMGWKWYHLFIFGFLFCYFATPAVRSLAIRFGVMDKPSARKVHRKPMPRLGGVAIYLGFVGAILVNFHFSYELKGVLVASSLMFLLGVAEDFREIPAVWRLAGQALAVLVLIKYGVVLTLFPPGPFYDVLEWLLTFLWVIGITNAFNFLDGLDGLASGLGAIASLAFLWIANHAGQGYLGLLAAAMAGACLGFLRFNFRPASIFMGDSGSTFIGFFLASLGIMGEWSQGNLVVSLAVPILILGLLIYDMIYITVSRVVSGKTRTLKEWVDYVGKDHLHHRFMEMGFSHSQTVLLIYFMAIILGFSAVKMHAADTPGILLELGQAAAVLVLISLLVIAARKR